MTGIRMTTLSNGLRVITDQVESMHSVALGIWVGVGTRHEDMIENGVAHMVEHMLFKGTQKRSAQDIVEQIENVGGSMNAYTSREVTSYHIHLLKDDINLGLDILADMYLNSTMPEDEIERERQVIIQEIGMNNDTPDDLVFDQFYEQAFPAQAMGAPILGTASIIENMHRQTLENYIQRFYTPQNTIISAAGAVDHDVFVAQAEKLFGTLQNAKSIMPSKARYEGGEIRTSKDLEQAHILLGFEGIERLDPDYYAAAALSTMLGGGMSSRLFQEIREKRGLVYSIYSFHSGYQDDGLFGIYAGTGSDKLTEIMPVICDEIQKFSASLTEEELVRAKAQINAGTLMGRESMMTRADQQAKHLIFRNKIYDLEAAVKTIDTIDVAAIRRVAGRIFSSPFTLAALGPIDELESFEDIKQRLTA